MAPTWLYLIGKGIEIGVLHVLTGSDHLSALATLSANEGVNSLKYGIKWGIGHSISLILVFSSMISFASGKNKFYLPDSANNSLEAFVSLFMILFGLYRAFKISERRRDQYIIAMSDLTFEEEQINLASEKEIEMERFPRSNEDFDDETCSNVSAQSGFVFSEPSNYGRLFMNILCPFGICQTSVKTYIVCASSIKVSKQSLAFCIGIVHGFAGLRGVLGVIPDDNLRDWKLAVIYLIYFSFSSTIVMGLYSLVYGIISERLSYKTKLGHQIELFSALLSILVGLLWLILLIIGRLVP